MYKIRAMQSCSSARRAFLPLVVLIVGSPGLAYAQSNAPPSYQLTEIKFNGLSRYSEVSASSATGLRVGDSVSMAQLKDAADRLANSGAFDKVSFRYMTRGNELKTEFDVTETANLFHCIFDNFVWFSPATLDGTVRARVPLYDGSIPERGTTVGDVVSVLESLLHANGISGTVEYIPTAEKVHGPISAVSFRVKGLSMPVRGMSIAGAAGVSEGELIAAASREIMGKDYSATDTRIVSSSVLLPIYHRHGYLNARFDAPQPSATAGAPAGSSFDVTVTIPVTEGLQYYWAGASWTGNHELSTDDLTALLAMKPTEIANQDKIDAGLFAVQNAYLKKGYIDVSLAPVVNLDDTTRLVRYDVPINEGTQYRMGHVQFQGISDKLNEEFTKKWQIASGSIYDGTYRDEFLKKIVFPKFVEIRTKPNVSVKLTRDFGHATVDLLFAFQ